MMVERYRNNTDCALIFIKRSHTVRFPVGICSMLPGTCLNNLSLDIPLLSSGLKNTSAEF